MEKKIYKISFSEYSTFLQCPQKWYLNYFLRLPGDTNEELIFGQILHKSIETIIGNKHLRKEMFFQGVVKNSLKNEVEKIKDINFLTRFKGASLEFVFIKQALELLKELKFFIRFNEYEVVDIEYKLDNLSILTIDNTEYVFKGYIDLVLKHKTTGKYLLLDWKSSKKSWDIQKKIKENEDLFTQLGLYKYFFSIKENIPLNKIEVKYFNMPREEPLKMESFSGNINETFIEYLLEKFKNICRSIHNHNPAKLDKAKFITKKNFCNRCHFNKEELCNDYDQFQVVDQNVTK